MNDWHEKMIKRDLESAKADYQLEIYLAEQRLEYLKALKAMRQLSNPVLKSETVINAVFIIVLLHLLAMAILIIIK